MAIHTHTQNQGLKKPPKTGKQKDKGELDVSSPHVLNAWKEQRRVMIAIAVEPVQQSLAQTKRRHYRSPNPPSYPRFFD